MHPLIQLFVLRLCACTPLFSTQPCVACIYTPKCSAPVAFLSLTMSLASSSCSVPRAHHCAIHRYLLKPINLSGAIIPIYATPLQSGGGHILVSSLLTTNIPSYLSSLSLNAVALSNAHTYQPLVRLRYTF